jgi:hypothetical protein
VLVILFVTLGVAIVILSSRSAYALIRLETSHARPTSKNETTMLKLTIRYACDIRFSLATVVFAGLN